MGVLDDLDAQAGAPHPVPQAAASEAPPKPHSVLDQLDAEAPMPQAASAGPGVGEDMLKSGVASVPKGIAGGLGAVGDVQHFLKSYNPFDWLAEKYKGAYPEQAAANEALHDKMHIHSDIGDASYPTSQNIRSAIEEKTGKLYEPQTTEGKYTGAIGETLSNPLTYLGSGSLLLKTMMGIGAGAGGEAGHELGDQVGLGAPGEVAGSVAGAVLTRRLGAASASAAPTRSALRASADGHYDAARNFGVEIDPKSTDQLAKDIATHLWDDRGFRPMKGLGKQTFKMLEELQAPRPSFNTDDIKSVRTALGNIAKANVVANNPERAAAIEAVNMIDDYMAKLGTKDVVANAHNLPALKQTMEAARGNYAASMRSATLEEMVDKATRRAARTGSGTNIDNTTRQNIDAIINNPKKRMQYTTQELDAMREVVNGTFFRNLGRYTGKLSPSGIVSATLGTKLGQAVAGKAGAVLGPAAGYLMKKAADSATSRAVARLNESTRARSPLYVSQHGTYRPPVTPSIIPPVYGSVSGRQEDQ